MPTRIERSHASQISRIFLWLNSGCNARCQMCDIWREPPGRQLTVADISRWVPEWTRLAVARVVVCGEPLLHPDLAEICAVIRDHGIRVDLLTNGMLLSRRAHVVARSCDALAVSLDGPPRVHDEVRGRRRAFDRLSAGVRRMHTLAPELGIDARCAVHRLNFRYLRQTVATAHELGLRSISFSGTDLHNEAAFRREGRLADEYYDGLAIRGAELDELAAEVDNIAREYAADFESSFISDSPERLRRILVGYYRGLSGQEPMPVPRCNAPWTSVVLEYDGTLRPCFPMRAYGNLFAADSLHAAVNSDEAVTWRSGLNVQTNPICQGCVCQTDITPETAHAWAIERDQPAIAQLNRTSPT